MKFYKYLYYRLYAWNLKAWGEKDMPHWNALYGVTFMMLLNLSIIAIILDILGFNILLEETPTATILTIGLLTLSINYFLFVRNGKYHQIASKFEDESKKTKNRNALLLWIYVILSFVVPNFLAYLSGKF